MRTLITKTKRSFAIVLAAAMVWSFSLSAVAADSSLATASLKNVTTIAGSGAYEQADGAAGSSSFRAPQGLAVLNDGTILVSDTQNHLIRAIKNGQVSTYAGITFDIDSRSVPIGGLADGERQLAVFNQPVGVVEDSQGNLYVADSQNHVIRKIDTKGQVSIHAGHPDGELGLTDGSALGARFYLPTDIAIAEDGTIYVADTLNHVIRRISPAGTVTTLNATAERAVEVTPGQVVLAGDYRDGRLSNALFNEPSGLVLDAQGNLYVSDSGNQAIRYINLALGTVSTVAGGTFSAYEDQALYRAGDYVDGAAASARFDAPKGLALTADGGLLIADSSNHAIRLLQSGIVSTVAGSANAIPGNVDGTETSGRLMFPTDVAVTASGDIYVADAYNNAIRKISAYTLPAGISADSTIQVAIGSKLITFDAEPQKVNSRVMVPVRAIAEELGYEVETDDNIIIRLTKGEAVIELEVGSANAKTSTGDQTSAVKLDAEPYIKDSRTYVPVRFISEQLGNQVDWVQSHQAVIIR